MISINIAFKRKLKWLYTLFVKFWHVGAKFDRIKFKPLNQLISLNYYIHYLQTINIKVVFKGENTGSLLWKV